MLKAKIHGAQVTGAKIDYEGSIQLDASLLELSGILPNEKVHVWNLTNGNRFETYTIVAPPRSGIVMINGAAAHLAQAGDKVIVCAFAQYNEEEARKHKPTVVLTDDNNCGRLKLDNTEH